MGLSCFRPPEYLYQTNTGLFIFRMKVPKDCQPLIQRKELRYSLKTSCIWTARKYLASIIPFIRDVLEGLRQGLYKNHFPKDLVTIIREGIVRSRTKNPPLYHPQEPVKATQKLDQDQPEGNSESDPQPTPEVEQQQEEETFSDLRQAFIKEKELSNGWRFKTQEDHEQVFSLFQEIFGDVPVSSIDKALMRTFKNTVMQLPPNMRKIKQYRKKTIPQILKMKPEQTISSHTINKYLSRLSNLFTYGVSHGYMSVNPATGLKVKLKSRPDQERKAFNTADLQKLFRELPTQEPYMYWTPLIALYTGCRLEEVCQLHLEDICEQDGVTVFDINDKHEKSLKTLSSHRLIPIHKTLMDLGLLEYAEELKSRGEHRLFPELRQRRDGYGQRVSRWFQRYKLSCGVVPEKSYHSFRHTFITHLKHKQVDPFMIHELDGHTIDSETMGRYGKRYTPEILLRKAIEKVDYKLSHIRP